MLSLILILIFLISLFVWLCLERRPKGYPKGPRGLPLVGNVLQLGEYPYETLTKMTQKYGPIIGLHLGNTRVVILHTPQIIKEVLKQDYCAARPETPYILRNTSGKWGVIASDGNDWMEQRRFVFHQLKDLGFGKRGCEGVIADEISYTIERLRNMCDKPVEDLERIFIAAVTNVMLELAFGHRMDQNDDSFLNWLLNCQHFFGNPTIMLMYNYTSWIWKWMPKCFQGQFNVLVLELNGFVEKEIETHRQTYNENAMRDFVDIYIRQIRATTDPASSFYKDKGWKNLTAVLGDLILGALDTTSVSMTWLFAYLCQYPEIQEKCRKEIEREYGRDRLPGLADKINLPYCEATVNEGLRLASIAPLASIRCVTKTTEYMGYVFPKDTHILANVWQAHMDESVWDDPQEFRPERFLTVDGKFKLNSNMLTFSTGKRACPGESLARQQMFLFTVALLQKFSFTYAPGEGPPVSKKGLSIIRHIKPYKAIVTPLSTQ